MRTTIHRAKDRGRGEYGWLQTRYSFSFADWHNPERMGFGALRVINDDRIAGQSGFGMHTHKDMEIITIVRSGTLTHKDSMGNTGTVRKGEVQVMSAGTGVAHSEYNDHDEELTLFQLWIHTDEQNHAPRYDQRAFAFPAIGQTLVVSPFGVAEGLHIHQRAYITLATIDAEHHATYEVKEKGNGIYVMVVEGEAAVAENKLTQRDAITIEGVTTISFATDTKVELLIIEAPMR
ncbi:MAG TPA: pirin family protein [Candidatus Paceibacterota bacterium]|nr:pirin family protein [Candidatus Paceibacterota bacterium]